MLGILIVSPAYVMCKDSQKENSHRWRINLFCVLDFWKGIPGNFLRSVCMSKN